MSSQVIIIFICLLLGKTAFTASFKDLSAEDRFQTALDKQTFQTILTSIADRLKNLDNIYSIQLPQTLENKLESYQRKIDSLDAKIIRLESLIMMNLDKISDNISTKNYKDDVAKTNTFRRLDFLYESINHRLNYVDRKNDAAHEKMQDKLDLLVMKLDKMEENMAQRGLEIEVELSEVLQFTEDLQTTGIHVENLVNMTAQILNETCSQNKMFMNFDKMNSKPVNNTDVSKILNTLQEQNNFTMNVTLSTESLLKEMKIKLADDFNSYANKVADMNSYFWKYNEAINEDMESMESTINNTRDELKNGIRALMLQIGKNHGKYSTSNEEAMQSIQENMEEILTSQKLFLEGCYKVQSDEAQIESEISETLEKLIDLFQGQMKTVMENIKSLDKTLKNHDSRLTRTVYQANTNIISLFDKTVRGNEKVEKDIAHIKTSVTSNLETVKEIQNTEEVYYKVTIDEILNIVKDLNTMSNSWISKDDIETYSEKIKEEVLVPINEISSMLSKVSDMYQLTKNNSDLMEHVDKNVTALVHLVYNSLKNGTEKEQAKLVLKHPYQQMNHETNTSNCIQKYDDLIDIRGDISLCGKEPTGENSTEKTITTIELGKYKAEGLSGQKNCTQDNIDIRGYLCSDNASTEASAEISEEHNKTASNINEAQDQDEALEISSGIKQAILDIFGSKPKDANEFLETIHSETTENIQSSTQTETTSVHQVGNNTTREEIILNIDVRNN